MKKLLLIAAAITIGTIASASTDLLVWSIDLSQNPNNDVAPGISSAGFNSISKFYLKSTETGKTFDLLGYTFMDQGLSQSAGDNFSNGLPFGDLGFSNPYYTNMSKLYTDIEAYLGTLDPANTEIKGNQWEFYMQLNNNSEMVAWSEHMYNPTANPSSSVYLQDVGASRFTPSGPYDPVTVPIFNFGSHLVPEPTSGLLMMLGAGLLALRRRRSA